MKTNFLFTTLILFLSVHLVSTAQDEPVYGLLIKKNAAKNKSIYTGTTTGEKSGIVGKDLDLLKFFPDVFDQGSYNTCVSHATNACYIIQKYASQGVIPSKEEIRQKSMSMIFPHAIITQGDCSQKVDIDTIAGFIKAQGNLFFSEFSTNYCSVSISKQQKTQANKNRFITSYEHLFNDEANDVQRTNAVLNYLSKEKKPVIVGMYLIRSNNFFRKSNRDSVYRPAYNKAPIFLNDADIVQDFGGHAMTVVGFDRVMYGGAFKILNSYGPNWGKKGYFWMPFKKFGECVGNAIRIVLSDDEPTFPPRSVTVGGEFIFKYTGENGANTDIIPYYTSNGIYEMQKKNWKVNQTFQLIVKSVLSKQSLCVFSIDAENKVELHWPLSESMGMDVIDQPDNKTNQMILPDENNMFQIQKSGSDHLIVLYSDNNISKDWKMIKTKLQSSGGGVEERLKVALGSRLMDTRGIKYQKSGMRFSASGTEVTGDIVPIILKVDSID